MCEDITLLDEMKAKTTEIMTEALNLKEKMLQFQEEMKSEVNTVLDRTPLLITHSQRLPTNLDCEDIESYQLPPPIIPQVIFLKFLFINIYIIINLLQLFIVIYY